MTRLQPHAFYDRRRKQAGLTLVETLTAFAIIAGVVASVLALAAQNARYLAASEDRFLAELAVGNALVENLADPAAPAMGETQVLVDLGGRRFVLTRSGVAAQEGIVQLTITARREGADQVLAQAATLKALAP